MASVTRDRKKYGAPTVYSDATRKKKAKELREEELQEEQSKGYSSGRFEAQHNSGGVRKRPIRYD